MAAGASGSGVGERDAFAPSHAPDLAPDRVETVQHQALAGARRRSRDVAAFVRLASVRASPQRFLGAISALATLEYERGTAFILAPVMLGAGALVYYSLDGEPGFAPLVAGFLALAGTAFAARDRLVPRLALLGLLLVVAGMLAAKTETWRAETQILGGEISTRLTGRVVAIDHQAGGRARLTLDVVATERPPLRYAPARVRVSARALAPEIVAGSTVVGIVRLLPPSGPVRPGGFDFAFRTYFDRIGASGFFLRGPELVAGIGAETSTTFRQWTENARNAIADHIRKRIGGAEGEIAAALVVGVRAGIPEAVNEALRRTGLAHILSISGLHMALVAGVIMGALRMSFALFPAFASRRPVKKYAAASAIAATAAYLFISGAEVAAERSFLMLAVMLMAVLFDRAALTMRNLAIAAIAILLTTPHEVRGPSFQMSFAATAALIGAYSAWSQYRERRTAGSQPGTGTRAQILSRKAWLFLLGLIATSLVAGLATTVYGVYHFQRVSPLTLVANLAVMPIVSFVVMPFAVMAAFAMPFGLDGFFLSVMGKGLSAMVFVAEWLSARSPLDEAGSIPGGAVVALTLALIIVSVGTTWLRAAAIPFVLIGLAVIAAREFPSVLISEDGRLVALRIGDGTLAVNRLRPNQFTLDNWSRATKSATILKPVVDRDEAAQPSGHGVPFSCDDKLCRAIAGSGHLVVHASNAAAGRSVCGVAAVLVIDDATARNPCKQRNTLVITKRDLARFGSAEVKFAAVPGKVRPTVSYAIAKPYRSWHEHRRFSRAARGLPPYVRAKRPGDDQGMQGPGM